MKLIDLRYHIFPAKRFANCDYANVHDRTFLFWKETWTKAFEGKAPSHGWIDHFQKQDFVTAITFKNDIVAAHLYTCYDITAESTKTSEIFSFVLPDTYKWLDRHDFRNLMSMEYLSVHPMVKRNELGIGFGKLTISLGARVAQDKGLDGAFGTPVREQKVASMAENVGGIIIQPSFLKYGLHVDLQLIPTKNLAEGKDEAVRSVSDYLWKTRVDYTLAFHSKLAA